jgi:uncharacterized membrane protein YdbT with pleckstrin-like domain
VVFLVLVAIPIVIYFTTQDALSSLLDNPIGFVLLVMLAGIFYLSVLLITFNSLLDHILDVWVVTNYRIIAIEQRGLFNRTFAEHLIERIQDVSSIKKGMLRTFLNYGDVRIQTAGEMEEFKFTDVTDPESTVQAINELLSQKIQKGHHPQDVSKPISN